MDFKDTEQKKVVHKKVNPWVDIFVPDSFDFFEDLDKVYKDWNDDLTRSFMEVVSDHSRETLKNYLLELTKIYHTFECYEEAAQKLTKWNAGMGGWLSLFDLGMLVERQASRLFFKRDDFRL